MHTVVGSTVILQQVRHNVQHGACQQRHGVACNMCHTHLLRDMFNNTVLGKLGFCSCRSSFELLNHKKKAYPRRM